MTDARACIRWFLPGWVLVLALAFMSVAWAAPALPPAPSAHVSDEAQVLSPTTRDSLSRRLARYEQERGHQIIVYIDRTTGQVPIEEFAVAAFEQWKIGRPKLDDGVGVFVMVEDRTVRVEVGYGLEPTLTDLLASQVIRKIMIPRIEQGDWDGAIVRGVEALVAVIEGSPGTLPADPEASASEPPKRQLSWLEILGVAIAVIVFVILLITNPRLALGLLVLIGHGALGGRGRSEGGGGFGGLGGRSGGGGATGHW